MQGTPPSHVLAEFEGTKGSSSATPSVENRDKGTTASESHQASATLEATTEPTPEPIEIVHGSPPRTPTPKVIPVVASSGSPKWWVKNESQIGPSQPKFFLACTLGKIHGNCSRQFFVIATKPSYVEEHFAHNMMRDKQALVSANATLQSEVEALKVQLSEVKASRDEKIANLEAQLQKSADEALDEGEKKGFDRGQAEGFDEGLIEGRARYLASDEHKALLAATRMEAARDFLKSSAFGIALEIKTAQSTIDAFELCRSQIKTLDGFVEGFDQNRLDPTLDAKLQISDVGEPPAADLTNLMF
ncbi:hypothetical protein Salat_2545100 [Sesamum alatum]|uniref:Uncharacterized protein n=1 Tax=Sesamum alatum TaxID=300844 RepID=A0AAE1XSD2_9LAMI|nr:hypothetical protein Salat_2545100 [Sesamum alatum]